MDSEDHNKVHLSVKDVQDTLEAYQCLKCTKFHCPLCPKDNIKFDENFQATGHLQTHLSWVVVHGCFKIYKCHLLCRITAHYHCCYCDKTVIRRTDFTKHLLIHTADKSAGGQATRTVANNQGEKSFTLVHGLTDQPSAMASERRDQQPTMVCGPTDHEMTHKITLLLLDLTKTNQHLYFRNKPAFYQKLRTAFTQKGYNLSTEKIRKKLSNMLTTYKRVKDRRRATGEGKNAWEYYTLMEELFGSSGIGTAPPGTIYSTPLFSEETSSNKSTTLQDQRPSSVQDQPAEDEHPGTSAMQSTTNLTSRQRRQTQSSQFLESYEAHAERRTAVLETLVRPDLERWRRLKERRRRSFERKMLTSMGTIVEELKKISKHQEQIIHLLQNQPQ